MCRDRSLRRLATVAFLALAGFGLGACENLTDIIPDSKKPLPGERKLLFPEGVPGVSQGVPQELIRSNQQASQPGQGQPVVATGAQPQQPEPQQQAEEKPKPKPRPKVQRAARQQPAQEQAEPAQQQPQQQQTSPWPSSPQQQPAQASPWPSSPAPGTFTR